MDPATIDDHKFLYTTKDVYTNLNLGELATHAEQQRGFIANKNKSLLVDSGDIKGRLPEDKFVVETKYAKKNVWWNEHGSDNKRLKRSNWKLIKQQLCKDVSQKDLYVIDGFYNHDEKHRLAVRLITTQASAAYFFKLTTVAPTVRELEGFEPQWVMMHSPETVLENYQDLEINSPKIIATNLKQRESLFVGTLYLREINKVLFSIMSYYLSLNDIGVFYCAVSVDEQARSTMFLGLSGSGKATLALDDEKSLVTNEAVCWTESRGLFSLESGLTLKAGSFNSDDARIKKILDSDVLIENPNFNENGNIIFGSKNENHNNTYLTFPRENFSNTITETNDPDTIIFLVKDAQGVLPRVSKLSKGQAIYYLLSGYTSTSAGIEDGVREPKVEFSSCYSQPFLLLEPTRYAKILRKRLKHSDAKVYMINVGWIEGNYKTGRRVPADETKMIVNYLLNKSDEVTFNFERQKYFNFKALTSIVDDQYSYYFKNTWEDSAQYKKQYKSLVKDFIKNYKQFENDEFAMKYKKFEPNI